jgi:hypothetical protein
MEAIEKSREASNPESYGEDEYDEEEEQERPSELEV